ncbi:MAG: nucleoside kinase, partial [Bacteroidaceae bacterium]|nr:nucleoside kinase [Bacteroidaceae bacterium]
MKTVTIYCVNTQSYHQVPKGITLEEVYHELGLELPYCVTSCKVNNRVEGLHYTINDARDLEFLNITSPSGLRTYTR